MRRIQRTVIAGSVLSAVTSVAAVGQETPESAEAPPQVVVTGTRVANRSALDTAVPVDVVTSEALSNVGVTEINQALSETLPSFNYPRPGLADGTDTIRPATLRGLSPDQTLVLLNSKRRHASSLVNVNGTIGRGAAAVDLNTIPTAAVQSIEVLRDGASAQYGSDAIAGVINVRLKEARDGGDVSLTYGQYETSYRASVPTRAVTTDVPANPTWPVPDTVERSRSDGGTTTASVWKGFGLGSTGFLTVTGEYKKQKLTRRDGYDSRQQYPLVNGAFDPRELTFPRFDAWYGEPEYKQYTAFLNAGNELGNGVKVYGWGSFQRRDAVSAGFFRRALDTRNVPEIYPDGFLPLIAPDVTDYSAAAGTTWNLGEWEMDTSLVYGKNKMEFTIENTLNASIGPTSPTRFDAGGFDYDQLVFNFSGVRKVDVGAFSSPLNVAAGLEARRESYSIFAGEPASYLNGGVLLPNGTPAASGAQVFPGFRPSNEVDEHRTAVGAYLDLEANLTEKFLGSAAVRAEHYSDFGSNVSGKIAGRYDFTRTFALRGSVQNGFRAPSLQQQFFATTSTNFINGVPFDITTFPATDPVALALGSKQLDAEKSLNYSLGFVWQLEAANVTVDAYRINITNRVVLSENLTQANVRDYLTSQGFIGVGGGRFFINGVDTETTGVDMVISVPLVTETAGRFDINVVGNYTKTDVTKVPQTQQLAALSPSPPLFDRVNVLTFEEGNPRTKFATVMNWSRAQFGATLRATRYGKVLDPGTTPALDFEMSPKTVVDLEGRLTLSDRVNVALGAENLFDEYPDRLPAVRNSTGNTPFSNYSPFGRSGRFVYGRMSMSF
ncbi:MAG TPA: TonB-dependent receptor [Steroidobacteraceae bacterium]|jgi:iron complex outermembrane receptor protein|nr:TonB-dependent receptor [Steroidobacteraceae bacterium]